MSIWSVGEQEQSPEEIREKHVVGQVFRPACGFVNINELLCWQTFPLQMGRRSRRCPFDAWEIIVLGVLRSLLILKGWFVAMPGELSHGD